MIETKNLTKYYGKSRGIIDLNLRVNEGDVFGFIGPNGAGKSTTIRALLGLIKPTSGSGTIMGMDIVKEHDKILKEIGYMPSEAMFYNGLRVDEMIKFSADLHKQDCSQEARNLCEQLQLDTKRKISELSFGNRKKVAIVCALQHNPKLCILDEPTSGLDPLMQKVFFDILHNRQKNGATIFLSSHVLSEIQRHCNRAAIIRNGKLVVSDSVEALSKTNAKRITVHGITEFGPIDGMRDLQVNTYGINFLYNGDMHTLLKNLSDTSLTDVTITEPDLDEIFMHYYTA